MTELILGQARFEMKIVQLAVNCPKFENLHLLRYRVPSVAREEAFHVVVSALGEKIWSSRRRT
jgi:hypothetical protein